MSLHTEVFFEGIPNEKYNVDSSPFCLQILPCVLWINEPVTDLWLMIVLGLTMMVWLDEGKPSSSWRVTSLRQTGTKNYELLKRNYNKIIKVWIKVTLHPKHFILSWRINIFRSFNINKTRLTYSHLQRQIFTKHVYYWKILVLIRWPTKVCIS